MNHRWLALSLLTASCGLYVDHDATHALATAHATWMHTASTMSAGFPADQTTVTLLTDNRHHRLLRPTASGQVWSWSGTSWFQTDSGEDTAPDGWNSMLYDPERDEIWALGGRTSNFGADGVYNSYLDTMWVWLNGNWALSNNLMPHSLNLGFATTYDTARKQYLIFGGEYGVTDYGYATQSFDTWVFDHGSWVSLAALGTHPDTSEGAQICFDEARGEAVMIGGHYDDDSELGEHYPSATWLWNGSQWRSVASPGTPADNGAVAAFAYDPTIGACVVVGGTSAANDAALNGTWVWMGDSWLNVETSTSPAVSGGASMAFDPMSGHLTIIGAATGNNAAGPGDSWQLIWQ